MKQYKQWTKRFVVLLASLLLVLLSLNYFVDPLGSHTLKRYSKFTNSDMLKFFNLKVYGDYDLALIGTSRVMKIDPIYIQELSHKKVANLALSAAHIQTLYPLASLIKSRGKNFIYGFDCFSLNSAGLNTSRLQEIRYHYEQLHYQYFLDKDLIAASFKTLRNLTLSRPFNYRLLREDELPAIYPKDKLEALFHDMYANYTLAPEQMIINLAKIADENDTFVIYPKYQHYYPLFQEHDIEAKYFHAIKLLVKNTKAKVYSFYGLNEITASKANFDNFGWHFKPKVAKPIFDEVFEKKRAHNGVLLTKENVDEVLTKTQQDIELNYASIHP